MRGEDRQKDWLKDTTSLPSIAPANGVSTIPHSFPPPPSNKIPLGRRTPYFASVRRALVPAIFSYKRSDIQPCAVVQPRPAFVGSSARPRVFWSSTATKGRQAGSQSVWQAGRWPRVLFSFFFVELRVRSTARWIFFFSFHFHFFFSSRL